MKTIKFNDGIGSRNIRHLNLLVTDKGIIVLFEGKDIPGFAKIVKEDYSKGGKWSHSTWEVAIPDDVFEFTFSQDWEMGEYFPCSTWEAAFEKMLIRHSELNFAEFQKFVRIHFPKKATEFDSSKEVIEKLSTESESFKEFLKARDELAKVESERKEVLEEIQKMEEVEKLKSESAELKQKVSAVKEKLKSKNYTSLADLKAMLA